MLMRHKGIDPVHDAFEYMLEQSGQAFKSAYDTAVLESNMGGIIRAQRKPAMKRLRTIINKWRPLFEVNQMAALPEATGSLHHAEDLVSHAKQVREYVSAQRIEESTLSHELGALFYGEIDRAIAKVESVAAQAQEISSIRLAELAESRRAAKAYERVLVAYRQTLRVLLGRGHCDVRSITKMIRGGGGGGGGVGDAEALPEGGVAIVDGGVDAEGGVGTEEAA